MAVSLQHVGIRTKNAEKIIKKFTDLFQFDLTATRKRNDVSQWLMKSGSTNIVVSQVCQKDNYVITPPADIHSQSHLVERVRDCISVGEINHSEQSPIFNYLCESEQKFASDSVFNIALRVKNVEQCFKRVVSVGSESLVIQPPTIVHDIDGYINYAIVKSNVGDIVHTLIDDANYNGTFLPGFQPVNDADLITNRRGLTQHVDHVTFAVPMGTSKDIISWYQECFSMKRFRINSEEDEDEGFLVHGKDVGLRLLAMEYWKCAETGLVFPGEGHPVRIVLAEPLPSQGRNQVNIFLDAHGGAGVQHIGLHTNNMLETVDTLKKNGVQFIEPPPAYYSQIGKLDDIHNVGESLQSLEKSGVLIDSEEDEEQTGTRYLLQSFTKPLFDKETFFLEVIQRHGATGFGAGNISALWRAVQAYMDGDKVKDSGHNE